MLGSFILLIPATGYEQKEMSRVQTHGCDEGSAEPHTKICAKHEEDYHPCCHETREPLFTLHAYAWCQCVLGDRACHCHVLIPGNSGSECVSVLLCLVL
jgi:hypothetical protein